MKLYFGAAPNGGLQRLNPKPKKQESVTAMQKCKDKKLEDFEGLTPDRSVKLDKYDRDVNANKFWHGEVYELDNKFYFVRRWGRNGAKGRHMIEVGYYRSGAREALKKLETEKREEGYTNDVSVLEKMAREIPE